MNWKTIAGIGLLGLAVYTVWQGQATWNSDIPLLTGGAGVALLVWSWR
jgi:hypothetical protein